MGQSLNLLPASFADFRREAEKRLPGIRYLRADQEIVVMADSGEVWQGAGAWVICLWALRPGSRPMHDDAANSIFRNDAAPAEASQHIRKEA